MKKNYQTPGLYCLTVTKEDILNTSLEESLIDVYDNVTADDFAKRTTSDE